MKLAVCVPPPNTHRRNEPHEYLGAALIYTILSGAGYDTQFLDFYNSPKPLNECVETIIAANYDWVGFSAPFLLEVVSAIEVAVHLRAKGFTGHITFGGVAATMNAEIVLEKYKEVDSIAIGESSDLILPFIRSLSSVDQLKNTPGFYFNTPNGIIKNPPPKRKIDLDNEPFIIPTLNQTLQNINSSRGCPFSCSFCCCDAYRKLASVQPWRAKSAERVVSEMERYHREYHKTYFIFVDDNFFGSCSRGRERAMEMADLIQEKELDISFGIECRVTDVNKRVMLALKGAGLQNVRLGVESGVQRMLNDWEKHTTAAQNAEAIKILSDIGVTVQVNYILIDPWTTHEELKQNLAFLKESKAYRLTSSPSLLYTNTLGILRGTKLASKTGGLELASLDKLYLTAGQYQILRQISGEYLYKPVDPLIEKFKGIHYHWVEIANKKEGHLRLSLRDAREDEECTRKVTRWLELYHELLINLFEYEVNHLPDLTPQEMTDYITNATNQYDLEVLGSTYEEFMEKINKRNIA
jgi:radical SAM superfamily enzyme YgiQ (UPF0313 family)